jgi:hypothetical protein
VEDLQRLSYSRRRNMQVCKSQHIGSAVVGLLNRTLQSGQTVSRADCIMFRRDNVPFCAVCRRAIAAILDLYARQ